MRRGMAYFVVAANVKRTFAELLYAIQRTASGEKKTSVAGALGMSRSTLSTFLKNKGDIKAQQNQHSGARRVRKAAFEDVGKPLHKRFIDARARNILVSVPKLQQKATNLAFILGAENFNASSGCFCVL